jgi:hypothetical protein
MTLHGPGERAGGLAGGALAPLTALMSWVRRSRMFHPVGMSCLATVEPAAQHGRAVNLSGRLPRHALVRFSGAWWKRHEWTDVLGCAVRLSAEPLHEQPRASDQDLLFATIRRPWTMLLAPLFTDVHDYLANDYHGVSPFRIEELGKVDLRVIADVGWPVGADRAARLASAIEAGRARLTLEWAPYTRCWRLPDEHRFAPLARFTLTEVVHLDDAALRFDPFRCGLEIEPAGFVHAVRMRTYHASQRARPASSARSNERAALWPRTLQRPGGAAAREPG